MVRSAWNRCSTSFLPQCFIMFLAILSPCSTLCKAWSLDSCVGLAWLICQTNGRFAADSKRHQVHATSLWWKHSFGSCVAVHDFTAYQYMLYHISSINHVMISFQLHPKQSSKHPHVESLQTHVFLIKRRASKGKDFKCLASGKTVTLTQFLCFFIFIMCTGMANDAINYYRNSYG